MAGLSIGNKTAEEIYREIVDVGMPQADAAILLSGWIYENFGRSKRVFNFRQPFAETEPGCQAQFNRTFGHDDWIDGESVVQAEVTAGEEGFNARFHRIEDDLDSIHSDLNKAFACMGEARAEIFQRFTEIRTELNRINSDIHNCCAKNDRPGGFTIPNTNIPTYPGLVNAGSFLGNIRYNDRWVALWETQQGYMMLPTVYSVNTGFLADDRVQRAGNIARLFAENAPIQRKFPPGGRVNIKELIRLFGNEKLANGDTLRQSLEVLPKRPQFASLEAIVDEVSSREASALRTRFGTKAAAAQAFGLDESEDVVIADAPVEKFEVIPPRARTVLASSGISTIGKFSQTSLEDLERAMKEAGLRTSSGDLAEWRSVARTLSAVR